jgi:hypothetical protein
MLGTHHIYASRHCGYSSQAAGGRRLRKGWPGLIKLGQGPKAKAPLEMLSPRAPSAGVGRELAVGGGFPWGGRSKTPTWSLTTEAQVRTSAVPRATVPRLHFRSRTACRTGALARQRQRAAVRQLQPS